MSQDSSVAGTMEHAGQSFLRLYVVFNNVPLKAGLDTSWGFACLIDGLEQTILFDTGGDGNILLSNMRELGLNAEEVELVVLSHIHSDHTGGLGALLARNPHVTVIMPASFPPSLQQEVAQFGATVATVSAPRQLLPGVYSTGEMGSTIKEQALILDSGEGLIVMTGCAHPNVADMAELAKTYRGQSIYLLMGGFHLGADNDAHISKVIARLKALGVKKVAPSHCTGDRAIRMFRDAWHDDFIESGLGAVIKVPQ